MNQVGDIIEFNGRRVLLMQAHGQKPIVQWGADCTRFKKGIGIFIDEPVYSLGLLLNRHFPAVNRLRNHIEWRKTLISSPAFIDFQHKHIPKDRWITFELA